MKAGHTDIMYVEIIDVENTGVGYAIGTDYATAKGSKIEGAKGKQLALAYPNVMFLTFFNTGVKGKFKFSYNYLD